MHRTSVRDEGGFAMMSVVMGMTAIVFMVAVIFMNASAEYQGAQTQRREDTIIAGAEAMLERYAAKLTIDPLYYQNYVDEAELPRRCRHRSRRHLGASRRRPSCHRRRGCATDRGRGPGGVPTDPGDHGRSPP